jgi:hypothetical protein
MRSIRLSFRSTAILCAVLCAAVLATAYGYPYVAAQENDPPETAAVAASPETDGPKVEIDRDADDLVSPDSMNLINAATYVFSSQNGVSLEDMSSGTTSVVPAGSDDGNSTLQNIGFDFWYDGTRHATFGVNANGLVRLGAVVSGLNFTNSLATTTEAPKIAAYWEDICVGASGQVHYKVTGMAPNRKLIVEWTGMEIPREGSCGTGPATGVFQLWLFESAASSTPGRIQFVYGNGIAPSTATDGGASIGLQAGAATNIASVTVSDDSVSYATANNTNLAGIAAGKSYIFTPANIPAQPTNLNFAMVTPLSQQLSWNDNSSNEVGFAIFRSTDNVSFTYVTQTAADAVSYNDTGLVPNTNYFYRVYAVTEGVQSPALAGSNSTGIPANISCNGAGGNWSSAATWMGGVVPTSVDDVTVGSGCTVTVDTTTAAALNVTIASGGTLQSPATGTVINNNLTVGGSVTNNGTLDFSTNGDTSAAILTFSGGLPAVTFSGSGATTDVRDIAINKGVLSSSVELSTSNFTVRGVNTDVAGFLTLTSGTFKISGTFTIANRVFTTTGYTIPTAGGFWLNNPNFTVPGQNGSPTNNGLLRVSNGTYNVGTASGNSLSGGTGAAFTIDGGTVNVAGRIQTTSAVSYTQSAGQVNVCTVGNTATTACFGLTSTANVFNLTGGTIALVLPSTNATPLDYSVSTAATFVTSPATTTLRLGSGTTPAGSNFRVVGATPSILINSGMTMSVGSGTAGAAIFMRGAAVQNDGAIVIQGTGASSRFDWAANGPMTYLGSGTFGTAATPFAGVGMSANSGTAANVNVASPIFINRINMFSGGFTNAGQITMGSGGASTTVIQIGNSTTPTNAGTFDVSPNYNSGTGGHIVLHLRTTTLNRPTGFEINPTRTLATWTIDENAVGSGYTVTGGNISVAALNLTNGVVTTGSNTITHTAAVARVAGYVNGNLARPFTATGAYTYHVGQNGYSPVAANVTAVTGTSSLTVAPVDATLPGLNPAVAVSRYWSLAETGDLTADVAFTYLDADINGTETDYRAYKLSGGVITNECSGGPCVNDTTNTVTVTGVSNFSDWGIAENGGATPGVLAFSSATFNVNENVASGVTTFTVNRTGGSAGAVSAAYSLTNGTATGGGMCAPGIDFINTGGTVNFANGETSKTFTVALCDDTVFEGNEDFSATLSMPTGGATIGMQSSAVMTIVDNEVAMPGTLVFSSATYNVNENVMGGVATITVNRTGGSDGAVSVNYGVAPGSTATGTGAACAAGDDYQFFGGTLNWASGDSAAKTFNISICDDSVNEGNETVNFALSSPTGGATIGTPGSGVLTIIDNDPAAANVVVNPGAGSYATLKDAIDAINAGTHTGMITVDIMASTTETAPSVLNSSGAGAASYGSIIIRPGADSVTVAGPTATGRGLIELNGADNVTINGDNPASMGTNRNLTLQNTAANTVTFTSVIRVALNTTTVNSADNNVFRNLNIVGSATGRNIVAQNGTGSVANTTYGIVVTGGASAATTAPAALASVTTTIGTGATGANLLVTNNSYATAGRAISVQGSATTVFPGLVITNNEVGNSTAGAADQIYVRGISAQGSANGLIQGNTVYVEGFIGSSGSSATVGIDVGGISAVGTFTIEKNKVNRVRNNEPQTWATYGINLNAGNTQIVRNNFVANVMNNQTAGTGAFNTTFGAIGIRAGTGTGHQIYHNSVNLSGALPGAVSTDLTAALGVAGTGLTGMNVVNNIFVNTITGGNPTGTRNVAVFLPSGGTSTMNLTLNNNDYFVGSDAQNRLAQVGTSFGSGEYTLADFDPSSTTPATNFRAYTSTLSAAGTNDNASLKVNPQFLSGTDLHLQSTSPVQNLGISGLVGDDIDGDSRGMPPEIGADEIPFVAVPGTLQFSSATYSVAENVMGGTVTLTVTRTGGTDGTVGATYAFTNGSATGGAMCGAGVDFINTGGTVSFANGEASKTITVGICDDAIFEGNETFTATLSMPTGGATIGMPATTTVTITDNEVAVPGTLQFSSATYSVAENVMGGTVTLTVTRMGGTDGSVGATYAFTNGSATGGGMCGAGVDFINTGGTVSFANGEASKTITVGICDDAIFEGNETFTATLSMPTGGATIGMPATTTVTITDNEVAVPGTLQFSSATYTVGEAGPTATITVTRTGGTDGAVSVNYGTSNGTATGGMACSTGVDFLATSGTLNWASGDSANKTFTVTICNDTADEPNETVNLTLSMPSGGATIGTPNPATLTITDDDLPAAVAFSISDARVTEGNAGTVNLAFTITLATVAPPPAMDGTDGFNYNVNYATANGTATAGSDYVAASGSVGFNGPGSQVVNVTVNGDTLKESNEFLFVNLTSPTGGATLADAQGAGIIVDDDRSYVADFDDDLKADYSVFRPGTKEWYTLQSSNGTFTIKTTGTGDIAVPGDYDGDGKTDVATFTTSNGVWSVQRSSDNIVQTTFWGVNGDKPVQGDYDGDGKTDIAIFRPSTGTWWVIRSSNSSNFATAFGTSGDKPMQGDYDGDARTDIAVYRGGTWYILRSSNGSVQIQNWGNATDRPVSGDFDGDGRNDLAIYRGAGEWWIVNSLSGTVRVVNFGIASDVPAPADFDGDGSTDITVYRNTGNWFVLRSSDTTVTGVKWGVGTDVAIPSAYIPQ